jgi:hypothetical protein
MQYVFGVQTLSTGFSRVAKSPHGLVGTFCVHALVTAGVALFDTAEGSGDGST